MINIRCCLSDFQPARPHAASCIKENTHLKVDLFFFLLFLFKKIFKPGVVVGGVKQRGCLLILKHLEGDLVASEARRVRESSEAAAAAAAATRPSSPQGRPGIAAAEETTGLVRGVQMGQCDDDETFYSKINTARRRLSAGDPRSASTPKPVPSSEAAPSEGDSALEHERVHTPEGFFFFFSGSF